MCKESETAPKQVTQIFCCGNGPNVAHSRPKPLFLAIKDPGDPRWLAKVDQKVDHSGRHVGGLP